MITKPPGQYTSIGGQAVIEGVMMRSPHFVAVAVRRPDQKIVIQHQPYSGWGQKHSILRKPLLRGVVTLVESMMLGVRALSFSANIASTEEESDEPLSHWAIVVSMLFAFVMGMGLFVALPHLIAVLVSSNTYFTVSLESPWFHLLDGLFKIMILLAYVYLIALMKDIHRVFQYHGAEHKSIYTFEAGEELTVKNARKYTTLHPRCGTSFLLFLVLISILVFSALFPVFNLTQLSSIPFLNHFYMILVKIVLMLPVAGIAYEFIKTCSLRMENPVFRMLIWPGMILQKLTTREPEDDQLEVALASLRKVLLLEKALESGKGQSTSQETQTEIADLSELGLVSAKVTEFLEV